LRFLRVTILQGGGSKSPIDFGMGLTTVQQYYTYRSWIFFTFFQPQSWGSSGWRVDCLVCANIQ